MPVGFGGAMGRICAPETANNLFSAYGEVTGARVLGPETPAPRAVWFLDFPITSLGPMAITTFVNAADRLRITVLAQGSLGAASAIGTGMVAPDVDLWFDARADRLALDPAIRRSLVSQKNLLLKLNHNWDGYGAQALPHQRVEAFFAELELVLVNYSGPLPEIVPGGDGSLQVEWHLEEAMIFYGIDSDDQKYIFVQENGTEPIALAGDEASQFFLKTMNKYFAGEATTVTYAAKE
ncbi:hypothetical protein NKI12_28675 [Mesorhizobium australicum]|uniref:Uncharacterized protein n=1 Tax=Mesorhizobium australicum TaxID=536018 RepID=A0ACC6T7B0_9HYPH